VRLRAQPPVHSPIGPAALLSGMRAAFTGGGAARERVERLLRETYQPSGLLLTDSGTTALQLALRLAVSERPGPVALPAYCCYDIASAADAAGVGFVFYDLDPTTLGPDWPSLRRAFDRGSQVVVAVHLYGIPVDFSAMDAMAAAAGGIVIEDAAQGAGARFGGRPAGSLSRYAILSFGRGKGMTGGRGGALLANAPEAAERLAGAAGLLTGQGGGGRDAAMLCAQWVLARPSVYGVPLSIPSLRLGETIYRAPTAPAAPSDFALGTLTRTLQLAPAEAERRRKNAGWLLERIQAGAPVSAPRPPAACEPGFLRLPVVVDRSALARFWTSSARALGVWPGYPTPLTDLGGFGARRLDPAEPTPGARTLAEQLFTLPTHGLLDRASLAGLAALLAPASGRTQL
jgi:dTDP-4-amino-4,6-dideoxygalactose transaminase